MRRASTLMAISLLITACNQGVPEVNDPHNVVVNGKKMTQLEFLEKYCVATVADENCAKVSYAMRQDSVTGGVPRF